MKKISIIICALIMTHNAYAATECVQLNPSTTECYAHLWSGNGKEHTDSEWWADCTTNGVQQKIVGVGFCSNESASFGTAKDSVDTAEDWRDYMKNEYCWCKMIYPAISDWVYVDEYSDDGPECMSACSYSCAYALQENDLEKYLFSHIHQY